MAPRLKAMLTGSEDGRQRLASMRTMAVLASVYRHIAALSLEGDVTVTRPRG